MKVSIYKNEGKIEKEVGCVEIDMQELGHEICMGIRHGLYGKSADDDSSGVSSGLYEIADSIRELADGVRSLVSTLETPETYYRLTDKGKKLLGLPGDKSTKKYHVDGGRLPFPVREEKSSMSSQGVDLVYDIPESDKEQVLHDLWPSKCEFRADDTVYDLHADKFFKFKECQVIFAGDCNLAVSPHYWEFGGTAIDIFDTEFGESVRSQRQETTK